MSEVTDRHSIDRIIHDQAEALHGFTVRTIDGEAGKVADHQERVDDDHLLVHVGSKLFGKDVVVENEAISGIDAEHHEIHVDRISDWVKASPKLKDLERQ